jgi:hypothetical protein
MTLPLLRRARDPLRRRSIADLMLALIERDLAIATYRRLVTSMALRVPVESMPDDECVLLSAVLEGEAPS